MKIKEKIDSYNINSLSAISGSVARMRDRCDRMDDLGKMVKYNIEIAKQEGYVDENSKKAELIIEEYSKKLASCRAELDELAESVKLFKEKMNDIWEGWR
jgi:hypothetical protein